MNRISFDDLDTDLNAAPVERVDIRAQAHIVNGGDATFTCPSCKGRGRFISYAGRDCGPCFKCGGSKTVSKGVAAAAKGKETKLARQAQWHQDNADAVAYVRRRADKGSTFYAGFLVSLEAYGTWTEKQTAIVRADMAKDEAFFAAKRAERVAAAPVIEMSAIEALFATATNNDIKRPIFRADGIEISTDREVGTKTLWVKQDGTNVGKITAGRFTAFRAATDATLPALQAVAADPTAAAIKYQRKTGRCGCCGQELVDPVSIRAGIGPICAENWGLDYRRELAREELKKEG